MKTSFSQNKNKMHLSVRLIALIMAMLLTLGVMTACNPRGSGDRSDVGETSAEISNTSSPSDSSSETGSGTGTGTDNDNTDTDSPSGETTVTSKDSSDTGSSNPPVDEPGPLSGNITMSDKFVYSRPDFAALEQQTDDVLKMIKDQTAAEADVKAAYEALEDAVNTSYTMTSINSIRQSEDVANKTYADEAVWLSEKTSALFVKLVQLDVAAFGSKYSKTLLGELTDEEIAYLHAMEKLADDEYVKLTAKETGYKNKYLAAETSVRIEVNGKEYNRAELEAAGLLNEKNDALWQSKYVDFVGNVLIDMIDVRNRIAKKAGYANYADFSYAVVYNRSYTPDDAAKFADAIKESFTALTDQNVYNFSMLEALFINNNYYGGKFDFTEYTDVYREYFNSVSPDMLAAFNDFLNEQRVSIGNEPNRQQGAFTSYLYSHSTPFIFMYRFGGAYDATTLIHEFGHYYAFYVHGDELSTDLDICEIHSQMNEMLFAPYWAKMVGEKSASGVIKYKLLEMAHTVLSGCQEDEFQRIIYSNPEKYSTVDTLNKLYTNLNQDYGINNDKTRWAQIHHTFEAPFYYISYATSAIPAMEGFILSQKDYPSAVKLYNDLITAGTEYDFVELLDRLNLGSPFDKSTITDIVSGIVNVFKQ